MVNRAYDNFLILVAGVIVCGFIINDLNLDERIQKLKKEKKIAPLMWSSESLRPKQSKPGELELGRLLFNDSILSRNGNISCASCHIPDKGFSNGEMFASGTHGKELKRHVPHLYNLTLNRSFFWDGRATTLEEQLALVLNSKDELDMNFKELIQRLKNNENYISKFYGVYPEGITKQTITKSIVAFEKSLVAGSSRYDQFLQGDTAVLLSIEKEGLDLFLGKANCIACHNGANLTDNTFHNVGVITDDLGRHVIDKVGMSKEFESTPYPFFSMYKAFKTPTLRNVANTAPYFHNGSKASLVEVIKFYNRGGENSDATGLAKEIKPLNLAEEEMIALVAFLQTLTSPPK